MAYHKNTLSLEKMLLKFLAEPDPMLAMLEWLDGVPSSVEFVIRSIDPNSSR